MNRDEIKSLCGTNLERETLMDQIQEGYPEQKPVCFNYMKAREDICLLCGVIRELASKDDMC